MRGVSFAGGGNMMRKFLGEMLIDAKLITAGQLSEALDIQKKDGNLLGITLVKMGYIEDEVLLDYLRDQGTKIKM